MKVFLDSDIVLDFLLKREPFFIEALQLFILKEKEDFKLYTSAIIISNVYYISSKQFPKPLIKQKIKELASIIQIVDSTRQSIYQSFESDFSDFEDAIQYHTALESKCTFFITRNTKDYKKAKNMRVLTAAQFCKLFVK
ncbi:MAG: PIN domain-containing protein [Chitinophagales bacterium]|nr:PIN domain-containing protein [Chitinophagales bacterium]